jgi:hypothetical protein
MYQEINGRLNLGNACDQYVPNLLSPHPLFKNVKIKIRKIIIHLIVQYRL